MFGEATPPRAVMTDPHVSPYFGDYQGLPPIYLAVSTSEVFYDDATTLYEKLKEEGHPVEIDIVEGICYAYATLPMMPEARKTLKKSIDFIENQ